MSVFEITIQRQDKDDWPGVVRHQPSAQALAQWSRGMLALEPARLEALRPTEKAYGTLLGRALFREIIRDAFVQACTGTSSGEGPLRMLLRSEGLFLSEGKAVTEAPEDFTHLPSCAGQRDISRNTRNTTLFPRNTKSAPVSAQGSNR